ncbi:MAG: putative protein of unknown function acetylesterase [Fibrobacteres bacterium]|nr:putative protein of unknown function acetylesterase [Fibrobacterota bacterium]
MSRARMRMRLRAMPAWLGPAIALILSACLETRVAEPDKGGNSSETVAMGKVVDVDGNSVMGAWVALVPEDFNPIKEASLPPGLTATTDAEGKFSIPNVPKGRYGFEARHPSDGSRLFTGGFDFQDATAGIPADTLHKTGKLRVRLPDYLKQAGGFVFLPHTRYAWPVTGTALEHGYLDLDSLPAATYEALAFSRDGDLPAADTLGRDLDVLPGDTLSVGEFAGWSRSGKVFINTTASGSFLDLPVTGFPMLVRLDGTNFDFASAAADGADLRFSKADGTALAFQIDHWDAAKKEAAAWVAIDTVQSNDSSQYFLMHWGKSGAASRSDGAGVFANAGYAAAWHLEESAPGTGTAGIYRNAVGNADHGTDSLTSSDQSGLIGNGGFFRNGEYIRVPSATAALKPVKTITLSAWVRPTATDSGGGEIASMGNDYGIRVASNGEAYVFCFNVPRTDSTNFILTTIGANLLDGQWHHFAAILDRNHIDIYVDGGYVRGADFPQGVLNYDGGPDFFIGHHGNGETNFDYTGYIDEVRMLPGISSAAWLRLSYLTQKPGASTLRFSP